MRWKRVSHLCKDYKKVRPDLLSFTMSETPLPSPQPNTTTSNRMRVLQVIVLALFSSITAFTVIATVIGPQVRTPTVNASAAPASSEHILMMALGAFGFIGFVVLGVFIRPALARKARSAWVDRPSDEVGGESVWNMFAVRTIVTAAFVEGVGLFGSIIHMLTGALPPLAAPVLAVLLLIAVFPTRVRLEQFVKFVTQ